MDSTLVRSLFVMKFVIFFSSIYVLVKRFTNQKVTRLFWPNCHCLGDFLIPCKANTIERIVQRNCY